MKNFKELAEIANESEQVFMPDRYQQPFIEAFQTLTGDEVPEMVGRKRTVKSGDRTYIWCRGRNIPAVVQAVSKTYPSLPVIGLTGSEWCAEYNCTPKVEPVQWGRCSEKKLGDVALIASQRDDVENIRRRSQRGFQLLNVVTAYPNLVLAMAMSDRCNLYPAYPVDGGVEGIADALGVPGVDLVSTGNTLSENSFVRIENLLEAYPALITGNLERRGQNGNV